MMACGEQFVPLEIGPRRLVLWDLADCVALLILELKIKHQIQNSQLDLARDWQCSIPKTD